MSDKITLLKHPPKDRLALYATSDLPAFQGPQIRRHISNCESCRNELEAFRRTLRKVQNAARAESSSSDAAGEWARLEQEILGNIAVGLAAARCIDKVGASRRLAWSAAVVVAVLSLLFVVGWMTHIPLAQTRHLFASLRKAVSSSSRTEPFRGLDTENGGIAVKSQNGKLLLTIPHSARVWASGNSQLSASFVDEQTGRVVITTVYGPTAYHQAAYEKDSSH